MASGAVSATAANLKRRSGVLALYKATLRQAQLLPAERVDGTITSIRKGYKECIELSDDEEIKAAIKNGFGRLGYLRTVTPRIDVRARRGQSTHKTKYVIREDQFVKGGREVRRPISNVVNTNPMHDVDVQKRLNYSKEREYIDSPHYKGKNFGDWVPSWTKPIEECVADGMRFAKGLERQDTPDEHRLARNSVGSKGGVKFERVRVSHATWDMSHRGDAFDTGAPQ